MREQVRALDNDLIMEEEAIDLDCQVCTACMLHHKTSLAAI